MNTRLPSRGWVCRSAIISVVVVLPLFAVGCSDRDSRPEVVVYCSVDEPFAQKVLQEFESRFDIRVRALFDAEASKTTGLVKKIEAERASPRADVFWSSEVFNTILMAEAGLLTPYRSDAADDIPERFKDPKGYWTGIGLRARVLAFDTRYLDPAEVPTRWRELADARWAGQSAIADPRFGTTRGHVAAMFALWGKDQAKEFLDALRRHNVTKASGNAHAVRMVVSGQVRLCATDTDDVWVAQRRRQPVNLVYPDMGDGGTLLIPNSIAVLANCKHPQEATKLVDFLVSADVERMLARSDSRNIPVRSALREELKLPLPPETRISYQRIANVMEEAITAANEILSR